MKCPFYISLLCCWAVWMTACTGPVILEEPEDKPSGTELNDGTHVRDSVPIIHLGTYSSPYTIGEALTLGRGKNVWVEGYIVGCCETTTMKSGNNYSAEAMTKSNILLADTFLTGKEDDYLYCLAIKLPNNSIEREELNLYDNPENYHRKVRILGDITLYLKGIGMENIYSYALANYETEDKNDDEDTEGELPDEDEDLDEPEMPHDPDATRKDTLSIAEGIKLQSKAAYNQVYIKGYIVGYYNNSYIRFNPSVEEINSLARNNVVLADDINERDEYNVIIVDLPTNTALREQVNLKDNPLNLNRSLTVKGRMTAFRKTDYHGCMETLSRFQDKEDYYFSIE